VSEFQDFPIKVQHASKHELTFLHRAVRNSFFSGFGTLSNFVLGFLFAGLTIRYLGEARAGYFMALAALTGLNAMLGDFGLGVPAVRRVAALNREGDLATARKVIGSVCTASLASSVAISVPIFCCFSPIFIWTRLSSEFHDDAFWAMVWTLGNFVVSGISTPWRATYNALERYDLISIPDSLFGLLSGLCGIATLMVVPTMGALAAVRLVLSVARLVVDACLTRRLVCGTIWPTWCWRLIRPLLSFGTWVYVGNLGSVLLGRLVSLILTTLLGSAALPYYEWPQRLYSQVHNSLASQSQFLFPMLASYGDGAGQQIHRLEDRLRWFIAVGSGAIYCCLASLGPVVVSLVVSPEFAERVRPLLYVACAQGFFQAQDIVPYYTSHAMGLGRPNSLIFLGQGLAVAGTAFLLIPILGCLGAGLAQLWVIPAVLVHQIWVRKVITPDLPWWGWIKSYNSVLLMVLGWLSMSLLVHRLLHPGVLADCAGALGGAVCGLAVLVVIEAVLCRENQRWTTLCRIAGYSSRHFR
jgi:O-antigen/teichoic acid export membrane protein